MNAIVTIDALEPSPSRQGVALTPDRMADFLESLQLMGNVSIACTRAQVARQTAYRERRRSPAFAAAWDAALVAARVHAEAELAERAVNGWEEAVFYHGEEVARRRRFSDRLLLAHLARLDRMAERADLAATVPLLDDMIDGLREGVELDAGDFPQSDCAAPVEAMHLASFAAEKVKAEFRHTQGGMSAADLRQDTVTPVTPCPQCGGACEDPAARLGPRDCQWLENRLVRMEAARPAHAPSPAEQAKELGETLSGDVEAWQLAAFEAGAEQWWLVTSAEVASSASGQGDQPASSSS